MTLGPGDLLQGRYRVHGALGRGGMGSVFEASEEGRVAPLVVKQLRLDAPELLESFRGEFALLSRLSSPHLLRVLDFGAERLRGDVHHYYVAERVEGVTLAEWARRSSLAQRLRAVADAVSGLAALHDAGIRHGDFTPSNVLVDREGAGVLIDLGCARPFGPPEPLAGTEGFLAPELLAGRSGDAPSDLFAVGATLRATLAGVEVTGAVARLMERLLREDPKARPQSCAEVLEILGRKPPRRARAWGPPRLLGRDAEVLAFEQWLDRFQSGDMAGRVIQVCGAPGMGSTRLLRELVWRAQLRVSVLRAAPGEAVSRLLATALGLSEAVTGRRGALAGASVLAERGESLLLVVEDAERLPGEERELLVTLLRSLASSGNLAVLVSASASLPCAAGLTLTCGPLAEEAVRAWVAPHVTDKRVRELLRVAGGKPKRIEQLLTEELSGGRSARDPAAEVAALPELPASERATLALVDALGGRLAPRRVGLSWPALEPLLARGLLERDGEEVELAVVARRALSSGALDARELTRGHERAAELWAAEDRPPSLRVAHVIYHLTLAGEVARAERMLLGELDALRRGPRRSGPLMLPLIRRSHRAALLLELSAVLLELGEPRLALGAAARAGRRTTEVTLERRAALLVADALTRLGKPARAERLLERRAEREPSGEHTAELLQRLGRARLSRGDYRGARAAAEQGLERATTPEVAAACHETLGVACAYTGDAARAEHELSLALALLGEEPVPRARARIQSHRATLAFRAGRLEEALSGYASALALAEEHDLDELIATGLLNLGTAEQQAGLWGDALRHYDRGARLALALGRTTTELTLEYNLANLYSEVGAFERAAEALERLERKADAARLAHFAPSIALVRAEISLLRGETEAAERVLERAEASLAARGWTRELLEVRLRRVDVELQRGKPREAERKLKALASAPPDEGAADLGLALEHAWARVDAALGRASALERLQRARSRAQQCGLRAVEALLETELSRTSEQLGRLDDARARGERARRLWDRVAEGLPEALMASFWRHARRAALLEQSKLRAPAPTGAEKQEAEAYRRLLSLNRRLNSSLSLDRVLEYAVQAALDLTEAERAFLLLVEPAPGGPTEPRVALARSSDPALPEGEGPSQSIVRRTLEREEPILTTDAQGDPRFAGQGSVHAMRLKSVLSVPVLSPSGVLGVLYVDCRVQRGRFSEGERELLAAFADQLALAIGNARLHQELAKKSAELAQQKHAVEQLSRGQAREIERLQREVQNQREALELRYDYSQIVGRGPAMRAVLSRLDRVIDSDASVLVLGESGTGKELVARAIHHNGPRKAGPFSAINCAALPETLLESELFGHVRGAFTGADRDKQGLLQAARGGTLFLDELGELPLSTQAKLLRVLQEREVRPLGAEESVPLDVRLLAATHRDLERAMADGKFREDLYYRLAVVQITLPPLRERPEDLPVLCQKILERLAREAGKKPPSLGQDALRLLSAHPFPGNVRELTNVLTRAFVLAPGEKIRAQDLDLGGRAGSAKRAGSRRDFERDEQERILAALRQARWNVSVVSRSLGIPRNTLYRKLKRYGLTRAP